VVGNILAGKNVQVIADHSSERMTEFA